MTKVIWGRFWDPLLAKDVDGILQRRMDEVIDGEYQNYKAKDGAFVREHFFNSPELKAMVADLSDDEIWKLNRGGHDPYKVYAAYHEAVNHKEQPTVIPPRPSRVMAPVPAKRKTLRTTPRKSMSTA